MDASRFNPALLVVLLALAAGLPAVSHAGWPTTPTGRDPICVPTSASHIANLAGASDGAGGAYFVWSDNRVGVSPPGPRVYAQHLLADGTPAWGDSGRAVCAVAALQDVPMAVSDGAGGVIAVWADFRADTSGDLWAQDLGPDGAPRWDAIGRPVCVVPLSHCRYARAASDAAGGVLVAWEDDRVSTSAPQVFAQRLDATGSAQWGTSGTRVCATGTSQALGAVSADGLSGGVIAWSDGGFPPVGHAQRLGPTGSALWPASGVLLNSATTGTMVADIAPTGDGGATFAWFDGRSQNGWAQIFAQRVSAGGVVQWAPTGVGLSGGAWPMYAPHLMPLAGGDVIVEWNDYENGGLNRVLAQRLDVSGTPQWGAPLSIVAAYSSSTPFVVAMAPDGAGGFVCAWSANDGLDWNTYQIRAQRVSGAGALLWDPAGVPLCLATYLRDYPVAVPDRGHGAIVGWRDWRSWPALEFDAAQVSGLGGLGDATTGTPPPVPPTALALSAPWPSPARAGESVALAVALPAPAHVRLAILDPGGRVVRVLVDADRAAGRWTARWDGRDRAGRRVAAGLYLARLETAGTSASRKLVLTP